MQPELGDGLDRAVLLVLEGVGLAEHLVGVGVGVGVSVRVKVRARARMKVRMRVR